jgi:hypothetical protein
LFIDTLHYTVRDEMAARLRFEPQAVHAGQEAPLPDCKKIERATKGEEDKSDLG